MSYDSFKKYFKSFFVSKDLELSKVKTVKYVELRRLAFELSLSLSAMFLLSNAQAASCSLPKSYYKNVSCTSDKNYFLAVRDFGAPVALIDNKGKKVVDLERYQRVDANKIAGGLMPVQRNSRVGYINLQGREVIPTMYDLLADSNSWARPVSEGRIVVKRNGEFGVVSISNQIVVPFSAATDTIDNYKNGTARVVKGKIVSLLDKNGNVKNDEQASNKASSSSKAATKTTKSVSATAKQTTPSKIEPNAFTTFQPYQQEGKWGFVDEQNVTMITYSFDEVKPFSEGLAAVRLGNKWGFVNLGGELVIPFSFDDDTIAASNSATELPAFIFKNSKARVSNLKNGTKMCIDKEGASISCG